jgi:Putative peptidoglycan binding domain
MQRISKSVGKGGKNEEADVKVVQELLNKFTKVGGYGKLNVDGKAGKNTFAAIKAFQEKVGGMGRADSLVEPGKNTFKKLNENPSTVAKEAKEGENGAAGGSSPSKGGGKVSGATSGVNKDIIEFLEAVANHYGKEIKVTSGLRDKKKQADVMWRYWTKTLDHGRIYKALKANEKLRKQLDGYWVTANESKSGDKGAAEKSFKSEIEKIADKLSLHLAGRAVDVTTNVDKKIHTVLSTHMHFVHEKNQEGETTCFHYDDGNGKVPKVTDAIKAKWPAPK